MRVFGLWVAVLLTVSVGGGCSCSPLAVPDGPDAATDGGDAGRASTDGGSSVDAGGPDAGSPDAGPPVVVNVDDPHNATLDSDCDGLTDQEEFSSSYGGGRKTDPARADTDRDGVLDGVEVGRTASVDTACGFVGDADPTTQTRPTETDSDLDGLSDGVEDANHDGATGATETDPLRPDSDGDTLTDGAEDANRDGQLSLGETSPRLRDTDQDGINDGVETSVVKTNPTLADTDSDTCSDGQEDLNQNGVVDPGETDPRLAGDCGSGSVPLDTDADGIPDIAEDTNGNHQYDPASQETDFRAKDTDGDGLADGLEDKNQNGRRDSAESDPRRRDTDCDGLIDGPDQPGANLKGEDQNASGSVQAGETDPVQSDTDGDGILDGVELGRTSFPDPVGCPGTLADADPTTTTDPAVADSDADGIADGAEDLDQNGKVDPGELDPRNSADGSGPAGQVCTAANLRKVVFSTAGEADVQLALPEGFVTTPITLGGTGRGLMGFDLDQNVAFVLYRQPAPGGAANPTDDEAALRATLSGEGALSNATTRAFTTWDGYPALQAFYEQAGGVDVKSRANALANALVGAGAGVLVPGGATGPFKLQAEYVHRSGSSVVVLVALTPLANYLEPAIFSVGDAAGGSALAQFGDGTSSQCERFAPATAKVDFLFVVDDSFSMDSSQTALGNAATALAGKLDNSTLDWRLALVTTEYHYATGSGSNVGVRRGFTRNIHQFRAWLTQNSGCSGGTCTGITNPTASPACDSNGAGVANGANGGCWIGVSGDGAEGMLGAARKAINDLTPGQGTGPGTEVLNRVRADAQVVVVFLGDADDQTSGATAVLRNCGQNGAQCEPIQNFLDFFTATGSGTHNPLGVPIATHGIVCPDGAQTGSSECNNEWRASPHREGAVITATQGVRGAINSNATITNAVGAIVDSAIAAAGHKTLKPPIGGSIKVALSAVGTPASCAATNLPRSRVNGFDFDGVARTLSFFGACRPASGATGAVSYRYWIDNSPSPDGSAPPCAADSKFSPSEPDFCVGRLVCNTATNLCECPAGCGASAPPGTVCNANKQICDFVCTPDCGGLCAGFQTCNPASCACQCAQSATCAPGYRFQNSAGVCGCVCDTAALGCGATYQADANACACVCKPGCGGCTDSTCNPSACACRQILQ